MKTTFNYRSNCDYPLFWNKSGDVLELLLMFCIIMVCNTRRALCSREGYTLTYYTLVWSLSTLKYLNFIFSDFLIQKYSKILHSKL